MFSHSTNSHSSLCLIPYVILVVFALYLMAVFSPNILSWQLFHSIIDHGGFIIQYVLIADVSFFSHGNVSQPVFSRGMCCSDIIAVVLILSIFTAFVLLHVSPHLMILVLCFERCCHFAVKD